jgi:GAF domain-containing protein
MFVVLSCRVAARIQPKGAQVKFVDSDCENARLSALSSYGLMDSLPEEAFDRVTRFAQKAFDVPIALVSLVDRDRQWFKSRQGFETRETPRDIAICSRTIESDEPLIVRDARDDARFRDNPLVTGEPHVRFYMGAPLRVRGGHRLGTVCAIDRRPRDAAPREIETLQELARLVSAEIDRRPTRVASPEDRLGGRERLVLGYLKARRGRNVDPTELIGQVFGLFAPAVSASLLRQDALGLRRSALVSNAARRAVDRLLERL